MNFLTDWKGVGRYLEHGGRVADAVEGLAQVFDAVRADLIVESDAHQLERVGAQLQAVLKPLVQVAHVLHLRTNHRTRSNRILQVSAP